MSNDDYILTAADLTKATEEELNALRYKCQTDLFWFANHVLRSARTKPLLRNVHGGICDTLINKYPTSDFGYTSGYAPETIKAFEDWSPIKERVILSSRGTLKSTLEAADVVQIILCEPNTRCILMSGRLGLAKSILRMARGYFESNEIIRALFPQFCDDIQVNANEFISPARHGVNYRDPTIQVATFGSTKAGIRGDYIKLDDATNEINCLAGNSRIVTMHGLHPISDIRPNDILPSGTVTGQWMSSPKTEILKLCISDGRELQLTPKHLIKVLKFPKLSKWDRGERKYKKGKLFWVAAKDLKKGDCIPFPLGGGFAKNKNERDDIAFTAGLIWGDGYGRKKGNSSRFSWFVPKEDKNHIKQVKSEIISGYSVNKTGDDYLVSWSAKSSRKLISWGFQKFGRKHESLPTKIMQDATEKEVCSFLRGWFDTDGCILSDGRIILVSRWRNSLRDAQLLLQKLGIASKIYESDKFFTAWGKKWKHAPDLRISNREDVRQFADKIGFSLARKKSLLSKIIGLPLIQKRRLFGKVVSCKPDGMSEVYDISVSNSHEFVAEGITVHNSATPELVEKTIEQYDDLDPILEPGGYIDFTGTRWAVDDLPEYIRRHGEEMEAETSRKHVLYFFQPIWKVKKVDDPSLSPVQIAKLQNERDQREKKHVLVPDDVELLWPEKLKAEYLWPQYRKNYRKFAAQYLLNPESAISGVFTNELLVRQTRPISECPMPHRSVTCINWDLSGISGKGDFAVGICGIWEDTGRLFIIDAIVERFRSSTDICNAIIRFYMKYNPDYHRIESANGSELLSGELRRIAEEADLERAFHPGWDPPTNEENAKTSRIMLLPGALESNKLQFFSGIPALQEIYKQFEKFSGKGKYKDDGPDCIAQLYQKWKNSIGPRSVSYLTPSGAVVDFQSEPPNAKDENVDPHADEKMYADIELLESMTAPHAE